VPMARSNKPYQLWNRPIKNTPPTIPPIPKKNSETLRAMYLF
jgi:hypothetical protein